MSQIKRTNTFQAITDITEQILQLEKELRERYGTSIDRYMGREYQKYIQDKIKLLRGEFKKLDKDKNSIVSFDELKNFFNENNPEAQTFYDQYYEFLFKLIGKNKGSELTINDFINLFILLEEKIRTKKIKIDKILDELDLSLERYNSNLEKNKAEKQLGNGLTDRSSVYISIIQAKGLVSSGLIGECDSFVFISFGDKKQQSNLVKGTSNPKWNERFSFPVTDPNASISIVVMDQLMLGSKKIGEISFALDELNDQKNHTDWYKLSLDGKTGNFGELYLSIQYIMSLKSFFNQVINETKNTVKLLTDASKLITPCYDQLEKPFGIIYSGDLEKVFHNSLIDKAEKTIEEYEKERAIKFANDDFNIPTRNRINDMQSFEKFKQKDPKSNLKVALLISYIVITFLILLGRTDFVNLLLSEELLYFYISQKTLNYNMIFIGGSILYDIIWLVMQYGNFIRSDYMDLERGVKIFVYILSIIAIIIKGLYLAILYSNKN